MNEATEEGDISFPFYHVSQVTSLECCPTLQQLVFISLLSHFSLLIRIEIDEAARNVLLRTPAQLIVSTQ